MLFTMFSAHFPSLKHWFVNEEVSWWDVSIVSETLCMTLCIFFFHHFCRHDTTRRSEVLTRKPSGRQQAKQEGMIERHCYQWRLLLGKWMLHHSHYSNWLLVLSGITVMCIYLDRHLQWGFSGLVLHFLPLQLLHQLRCTWFGNKVQWTTLCTSGLQGNSWVLKLFWV